MLLKIELCHGAHEANDFLAGKAERDIVSVTPFAVPPAAGQQAGAPAVQFLILYRQKEEKDTRSAGAMMVPI
jgi:hypothetical protein